MKQPRPHRGQMEDWPKKQSPPKLVADMTIQPWKRKRKTTHHDDEKKERRGLKTPHDDEDKERRRMKAPYDDAKRTEQRRCLGMKMPGSQSAEPDGVRATQQKYPRLDPAGEAP